jgi:hypothetical protein
LDQIARNRRRLARTPYIWVFVGESEAGYMVEHKEDRRMLAKWGNDLRQTYRTLGAEPKRQRT